MIYLAGQRLSISLRISSAQNCVSNRAQYDGGKRVPATMESLKKAVNAQWNLDVQFKEHKCKRQDGESLALNRVYPTTGITA